MKKRTKVISSSLAGLALVGGIGLTGLTSASAAPKHKPVKTAKPYKHIFVIMMENEGTSSIIGNSNAPFINHLAKTYGFDDQYFGVTHPSLPNYVAALSGNTWYSNSDDPTQTFSHESLMNQLDASKLTWKGYMESIPYAGFKGYWYPDNEPAGTSPATMPPNALYGLKHDPFLLFPGVAKRDAKDVVPLTQLGKDLKSNHVPNFAWISPNMIDDMHGQPPGPGATYTYDNMTPLYKAGDKFIKTWVNKIMASKTWKQGNSLIVITWDEATYPGGNPTSEQLQTYSSPGPDSPTVLAGTLGDGTNWPGGVYGGGNIPFIFINSREKGHTVIHTWADHYSLLRTIESNFRLGYLGMAGDSQQVRTLNLGQNK